LIADPGCDKRSAELLGCWRGGGAEAVVVSLSQLLAQLRGLQNPYFYTAHSAVNLWLNFLGFSVESWRSRLVVEMVAK